MKLSNKKINNGRSMIEMLGVLALMAILSLVGVYMLQRSMLVHRTNQLVEDMRLAGMVVLDGLYDDLTTQEMSIKGHFEQQTPYEFAAAMESDTLNTFYVIAKGVPFDVCVEVKNRKPQWAEQIVANDEQDTCIEGENNDMGFFFNDELVELMDSCSTDAECGECGKCKNNRCHYGFKNKSGECKSCDDKGDAIYLGVAYNKASYRILNVTKEECNRCSNRMYSSWEGGRCAEKLTPELNFWDSVSKEECEKFPNQYSFHCTGNGRTYCIYCAGNFDSATGLCDTTTCDHSITKEIIGLTKEKCESCGGRHNSGYGNMNICEFF